MGEEGGAGFLYHSPQGHREEGVQARGREGESRLSQRVETRGRRIEGPNPSSFPANKNSILSCLLYLILCLLSPCIWLRSYYIFFSITYFLLFSESLSSLHL